MKNLIALLIIVVIAGCNKKNQTPPPVPQNTNQNSAPTSTMTAAESALVGKWYYEKYETIGNGSITTQFTYTTAPALNSIEFKNTMSASSSTANPNYKDLDRVTNGAVINNGVWKINDVGILSMNLFGADPKAQLDSVTSSRLVYFQYTSLQPANGTRYYLHK